LFVGFPSRIVAVFESRSPSPIPCLTPQFVVAAIQREAFVKHAMLNQMLHILALDELFPCLVTGFVVDGYVIE
jgi:hypothetical protein